MEIREMGIDLGKAAIHPLGLDSTGGADPKAHY
jgi:hypothetical protein